MALKIQETKLLQLKSRYRDTFGADVGSLPHTGNSYITSYDGKLNNHTYSAKDDKFDDYETLKAQEAVIPKNRRRRRSRCHSAPSSR